jgi:hypothetical protein
MGKNKEFVLFTKYDFMRILLKSNNFALGSITSSAYISSHSLLEALVERCCGGIMSSDAWQVCRRPLQKLKKASSR